LFGPSDAVVVTAVAGSGGVSAVIDLRSRRVPNPLTLGVAALGLTLAVLGLSGHTLLGPRGVVVAFVYAALAGGLLALIVARRRRVLRQTFERTATLVRTGGRNVAEIEHGTIDNRFAYAPAIAIGAIAAALGW
jgi:prepilin signal peptidase PulO-like enzyme (type II secretory pathway)